MFEVYEKLEKGFDGRVDDFISLDHLQRERARLKVTSDGGEEVRLFLDRGDLLLNGDVLRSNCNKLIGVRLQAEPVITATATTWSDHSRACYHLGNRHTRIQIGELWVRFLEDPVLIELVERFGLSVIKETAEFEPEIGAYGHGHAGKPRADER